ncbi:EF-hand domain-containing protein [Pseudomarimonas arenosa]|uniref:Calcium-binding protein n=1 Tax=Pseudomarimonas arenosa TaxID=2774145 RepID=A0AAW3ZRL2_9GAMM|nr:calcium-binding protein [Pseudomarimonas arenosa]MBD8527709.1 calcium-binding protein [Pseudomarimonas arenosa]
MSKTNHIPHRNLPWVLGSAAAALALVIGAGLATAGPRDHGHKGSRALPFEQADANADGQVTRAEADQYAAERVAAADMDGDGLVSFEEAKAQRQAKREQRARDRFMRLDADGDGQVSVAEFQTPEARVFARLDKNDDGVISSDERPRQRMRHREGRQQQ